jgi:hypothetical protein
MPIDLDYLSYINFVDEWDEVTAPHGVSLPSKNLSLRRKSDFWPLSKKMMDSGLLSEIWNYGGAERFRESDRVDRGNSFWHVLYAI